MVNYILHIYERIFAFRIKSMKLTEQALKAIDSMNIRMKVAIALRKSDDTIKRYIRTNDDSLTKAASLQVIKDETGLTEDEILEQVI